MIELIQKNINNLHKLDFSYDFSKKSTEKIEYNLFGDPLIFEIYESVGLISSFIETEDNFTPTIRMNIYEKSGETILKGIPIINYTDLLAPIRSNIRFENIFLCCIPFSDKGVKDGVKLDNIGDDTGLVAFNDK